MEWNMLERGQSNNKERRQKMKTAMKQKYTMIEVMMTIGIILILAALLFPALDQAKTHARFARWQAFNELVNGDPDCVINFNFQGKNSALLVSRAEGCDTSDFRRETYDGVLNGNFAWTDGRWPTLKQALQFNGTDTYVSMEGGKASNFAGDDNFTITCWVRFDDLNRVNMVLSKSNPEGTQYELYAADGQVGAVLFGHELNVPSSEIQPGKWIHMALQFNMNQQVASASGPGTYAMATGDLPNGISHVIFFLADGTTVKIDEYPGDVKDPSDPKQYIAGIEQMFGKPVAEYAFTIKAGTKHYDENGNVVPNIPNQADHTVFTTDIPVVTSPGDDGGAPTAPVVADGGGKGVVLVYVNGKPVGSKAISFDPAKFSAATPLTIGAEGIWAGDAPGSKRNHLAGRMDELIISKRPLPEAEVRAHYEMGAGL